MNRAARPAASGGRSPAAVNRFTALVSFVGSMTPLFRTRSRKSSGVLGTGIGHLASNEGREPGEAAIRGEDETGRADPESVRDSNERVGVRERKNYRPKAAKSPPPTTTRAATAMAMRRPFRPR